MTVYEPKYSLKQISVRLWTCNIPTSPQSFKFKSINKPYRFN